MEGEHTVSALTKKRAETAGDIERMEEALGQLRADLVHLDAVLRIFDPVGAQKAVAPFRKRDASGYFAKGELPRLILETVRKRGPIATPDLAKVIIQGKGHSTDDRALYTEVVRKVRFTLNKQRERGLVAREDGEAGMAVWRSSANVCTRR